MRDENIKTQVLWREEKKCIKNVKYQYQELHFDRKGNRTEEVIFNARNKIVFHKSYIYNNDQLIHEIELDAKGRIKQRTEYRYVGKLRVEKKVFNVNGELISKDEYIYEYQD